MGVPLPIHTMKLRMAPRMEPASKPSTVRYALPIHVTLPQSLPRRSTTISRVKSGLQCAHTCVCSMLANSRSGSMQGISSARGIMRRGNPRLSRAFSYGDPPSALRLALRAPLVVDSRLLRMRTAIPRFDASSYPIGAACQVKLD
jgi:hypothetical protein